MNAILANVQKLERETRDERREVASRLVMIGASLAMALVTAYAVVTVFTHTAGL